MPPFLHRLIALILLLSGPWLPISGPGSMAWASGGEAKSEFYWELRADTLARELSELLSEPNAGEAKTAEKIEEIAQKILDDYTTQLRLDAQAKRQLWQRFKQAFNAQGIAKFIQTKRDSFVRLLRTQGIPALATLVVEVIVNVGGTWLVNMLGAPGLVPVILGTPTYLIAHPVNMALYRKWESAEYARKFGSKESYQAYTELRKAARRELLIESETQVLGTLAEGSVDSVSVKLGSPNPLRKIGYLFGMYRDDLTSGSLLQFLKSEGVKDSFLERFARIKTIDEPTKLYLMLNHVQQTVDDDIWVSVKVQYHGSFVEAKGSSLTPALRAWLREAAALQNPSDLPRLLRLAPRELSPAAKWTLWFELILPRAVENVALQMDGKELKDLRAASLETWILSQKHLVDPAARKYTDGELRSEFLSRLKTTGQVQGVCADLFREMAI